METEDELADGQQTRMVDGGCTFCTDLLSKRAPSNVVMGGVGGGGGKEALSNVLDLSHGSTINTSWATRIRMWMILATQMRRMRYMEMYENGGS